MKRKGEDNEMDIDCLTVMMKGSNIFDEDDEMKLLLEGYNCKWDGYRGMEILNKAVTRYNRYIRNINFGEYSYIEDSITRFLQKYRCEDNTKEAWTFQAMKEMIEIDGGILYIIEMGVESSQIGDRKRKKI